jgi:porphobilinogen synthase
MPAGYNDTMEKLTNRLSRLRSSPILRAMVRETRVDVTDLIQPIFVHHDPKTKKPIASMPGQYQLGLGKLTAYARRLEMLGIKAVLLFGIPAHKDAVGSDTWDDENGVIQNAVRILKKSVPDLFVITDVCFCEYTDHGHCGVLKGRNGHKVIDHEATRENLARQVVSHARAGADMVAPSGMIDGAVAAIRHALDRNDHTHIPILSYAAKYASSFYGPFRAAAEGGPKFGDRRTHQMDPANALEALREVKQDIDEGADIVMIKPALAYLDVIRRVKDTFGLPTAAYNVSGEYAMVKAAAAQGWISEKDAVREILTAIKRAGADLIITYHAEQFAQWNQQ